MDETIYSPEQTGEYQKEVKLTTVSRFKNGSRRLQQAIDMLLDYLFEVGSESLESEPGEQKTDTS